MLLCMVCTGAWAQSHVTSPSVSTSSTRYSYTLNCKSTAHAGYIADTSSGTTNNGQINGQKSEDEATRFVFESAGETNKYYIKSIKSGKYINAASTSENAAVTLGTSHTTTWTVTEYSNTGTVGIFPDGSTNTSINNNGGTNNMRIGPLTSTSNQCSMWYLNEYEENIALEEGTTELRPTYVSTTSTKTGSSEMPNMLVDASGTGSKWGEGFTNGTTILSVVVRADNSVLKGYTLYNANDTHSWPGRSWRTWTVSGSNDPNAEDLDWDVLDSRTNVTMDCSSQYKANQYIVSNPQNTPYNYYKITLTRIDGFGNNGTMHQMSDLKFNVKYNTEPVNITYVYKYNGAEKHRATIQNVVPGLEFPSPASAWAAMPYGFTAPAPTGTVPTTPEESYEIELSTANYPFQFSDSYETAKWTALRVRPDNNHRYYMKYETSGETNVKAVTAKYDESNVDAYSWAFVGNPFDGFKVYNKAVGESMVWSSSANPRVMNNDGKKWLLTTPWNDATSANYNTLNCFSIIPQDGSTTERNNVQSNTIKTWSGNDQGSAFWVEPILAKGHKFVARNVGTANRYAYFSQSSNTVKNDANRDQSGKQYLILYPHTEGGYYIYNATVDRVVGKTQGSNTATPTVDSENKANAGRYTFTQVTSSTQCTSYFSIKCENSTWSGYESTRCYWHVNNSVSNGNIIPWEAGSSSNTSSEWIIEDEGEATDEEMQAVKDFLGITDPAYVNVVYKYTDDAGQVQTLKTISNLEVSLSHGVAQVPINLTANESAAFKEVSYTFGEAEPVVIEHGNSIVALSTATSDLALSKNETNEVIVNLTLHPLPQEGKLYRLIAEENTARYMYKGNDNVMHAGCNTRSGERLEMFYIVPTHNTGEYELVSAANGLGYPELVWQNQSCTLSTERSGHFTFTRASAAQNLSILVGQAHQTGNKHYLHANGGEGTNIVVWDNTGGHSRWYMHEVEESELNGETPASIISSLEKAYAQTILNTRGVGYPIAESATYNTLKSVIDNEESTIAQLSAAVSAYKTSATDVQMPVSGKAYKLNFLHNNATRTKRYIKYDAENGLGLTTTAAEAATILFTEVDATNHKFILTLPDGNLITWRGGDGNEFKVDGTNVKGYSLMVANQDEQDDWNLNWFTDQSTSVKEFGTIRMASRRNSEATSSWIIGNGGAWEKAGETAWFAEEGATSALQFEEVAEVTSETEGYKDGVEKYTLYTTAKANNTTYASYFGEGLGKYHFTTKDAVVQTSGYMDAVKACTTLEQERNVVNGIVINQPETGRFYRFKIGEKYMSNEAESDNVRVVTTETNTAKSVYYLTENSELIAYADGFGFNYGYCKPVVAGITNTFAFSEGTSVGSYNIHSYPGTGDTTWSNRDITISGDKLSQGKGAWVIEEVTELPVTIGATKFATFYTPVELQVPSGVTAYVCNLDGENLAMFTCKQKDSDEHTLIPAGTAVMLNAPGQTEATSYNFAITAGAQAEDYSNNSFFGSVATKAFESMDAATYYSLQRDNQNDGMVGFFVKPSGNFKGFQAFLSTPAEVAPVQRFNVTFDEDAIVTGIANVLGTENITIPAYDLSGRKVDANTHRGLYIMNGKKVIR